VTSRPTLDDENAAFWDELCGTTLARKVGVTGRTADDLRRFDAAYLRFYPYLAGYVPTDLSGARVLEVGLGYGTLGQLIAERGATYTGLDVARGPVEMMRHRLDLIGRAAECDARQASVLELPFEDATFDWVVSIGCLHHTGDLSRAVSEVGRVLRRGGRALVMLYNKRSARRIIMKPITPIVHRLRRRRDAGDAERALYDQNQEGVSAPHTDFVSQHDVCELFHDFASVQVEARNLSFAWMPPLRRPALAARLDRIGGLDLYVMAER
jgi:SAM-dependent methyltransferase